MTSDDFFFLFLLLSLAYAQKGDVIKISTIENK